MYEYISRRVLDDDLRQDIYVKLLQSEDKEFDSWEETRNWVSRVIKNMRKDQGQQEQNRRRLEAEHADEIMSWAAPSHGLNGNGNYRSAPAIYNDNGESYGGTQQSLDGSGGIAPDPLDILIADELEEELLGDLSELEKDVYGLCIVGNHDYDEAAALLDISYAALRQHVSRIKRKFNGKTNKEDEETKTIHKTA